MTRSTKTWLIIAVVLVLLGAFAVFGVLAANDWQLPSSAVAKYETRSFDITEAFTDISVESDTENIRLVPAPDGKCRVEFYNESKKEVSAAVQNGTLTVRSLDPREWHDRFTLFSFGSPGPAITVYLPNTEYGAVKISEHTGDVDIPSDFTFASVDIAVTTGDVQCNASAAGPISIKTDTGSIRMNSAKAQALTLSVTTGHIMVSSGEFTDIGVSVSTGRATISDTSCESLTSTGSTGDLNLTGVIASGKLFVKRSTGHVRFDMCDAAELEVETDTGDITGSLLTEKVFIAKTDTGRIEVPETTAGGKCKLTTDTGDIKIEIP